MTIISLPIERVIRACLPWLSLSLLAWVLATVPLTTVVGWLGATAGLFLLLRWPWLLWLGLAVALPVSSGIKLGPLSMTDVGLAAAVILWFIEGVRRRTLQLTISPVIVALLMYVGALLLALHGALNLGEALAEVVKWVEVGVVLLVLRPMLPPQQTHWFVAALLVGSVGQALLGLYQFIFQIGPEWFIILGRFMRASGSFHQPNPYAGYLGLSLPVAASLAIWSWNRCWSSRMENPKFFLWALFYTLSSGVIALGLLASWSRGGWMGAVVGLTVVVVLRSQRAMMLGVGGIAVLLITLLLGSTLPAWIPTPITARLQDIPAYFGLGDVLNQPVTDENFAVIERVAHWVAALRMWEQAPWLGVGPGNYATVYPTVRLPRWEEPLGHAHNLYLNTLAESGLVGLSAYLLLWLIVIRWLWQQRHLAIKQQAHWVAALALGSLGVIGHSLTHNIFDNLFVQGSYLQVAFWLAALSVASPAPTGAGDHEIIVEPLT